MSKESSKKLFEWYAEVALERLKEIKSLHDKEDITFKDCKTEKEFKEYMLNVFIAHYGLRCTCHDCMDWDFSNASSHYHHCDLWKFCHIVQRCLDWQHNNKSKE